MKLKKHQKFKKKIQKKSLKNFVVKLFSNKEIFRTKFQIWCGFYQWI